jgi:phospholipase/carboxylesterase
VLLVHGDEDTMIPVAALHSAETALRGLGFELTTHVSRGLGHSIDMDGLRLGAEFLSRVLG